MKKSTDFFYDLVLRYAILVLLGLPFFGVFYLVFFPLTIYPVQFILNIFYQVFKFSDLLLVNNFPIRIIEACVAPSAYYLLLILNLSTPEIKIQKRIKIFLVSSIFLLILNILRIVFLSILHVSNSSWFNAAHTIFWFLLSVVFVVAIWFLMVKNYKIKNIPIYSDLLNIYKLSLFKKRKKRKARK